MKRGIFLVLGVFLVLSLSFTSAGLFDFLKKKEIVTITPTAKVVQDFEVNSSGYSSNESNKSDLTKEEFFENDFFNRFLDIFKI